MVIPSAARARRAIPASLAGRDRRRPTKRRAGPRVTFLPVALFLPLYSFARAPIAARISMNIAQSFEKLRYGLYLDSLGLSETGKRINEWIKYGWNSDNEFMQRLYRGLSRRGAALISFLGTNAGD